LVLKTLSQIGGRVIAIGRDAASKAVDSLVDTLPNMRAQLETSLEKTLELLTPIEVVVSCVPYGPLANDYTVRIEHSEFDEAIKAWRFARPKIVVKATRPDLDRLVLTERMVAGLAPLLTSYKDKADRKRQEVKEEQMLRDLNTGLLVFDTFTTFFFLALIGAGALVGPILWLLVGIGGISALMQVPSFVINSMKDIAFGTEAEQLDAETQAAMKAVEAMVKEMEIVIDPDLQ